MRVLRDRGPQHGELLDRLLTEFNEYLRRGEGRAQSPTVGDDANDPELGDVAVRLFLRCESF